MLSTCIKNFLPLMSTLSFEACEKSTTRNLIWHCIISQLQKLTVPLLKAYLKGIGEKTSGKKQDLIEAVKNYLGL